jgi:hypothetical protein
MSLASLCTTTATIERKSTAASTYGGHTNTYATAYSDVPGTLQPIGGHLRERFARMGIEVSHVYYTPQAITTQAGDRLVISGVNYPIDHTEDMGGRGRAYAIYVKQTD